MGITREKGKEKTRAAPLEAEEGEKEKRK